LLYDSATSLAQFGEVSGAYDRSADLSSEDGPRASSALTAARRLVLGCVLELERTGAVTQTSPAPRRPSRRAANAEPKAWTFKLTRDVDVDARDVVREFLGGQGSPQRVQTLVRGHWQRYAVGSGRELREWRHKEPYWKGPEEAPIGVRSHRLG